MKNTVLKKGVSLLRLPLKERVLQLLLAAVLLFVLLPLFVMCFYAHPVYDDFSHTLDTARVWAQTGNLTDVLRSAWQHTLQLYETWQGTFVAMFFSAWQPMVFSPGWFWITPFATLVCLCLSAWFFVRQLVLRLLQANRTAALGVYTVLMGFLLAYMPGMREVIYWQSGTPYTLSVIALFVLTGMLISLHLGAKHPLWRIAVSMLMGAVIGGCPYPLALGCTLGALFAAVWCIRSRSRARAGAVLSFVSALGALAAVVAAPGNYVRQARVGSSLPPVETIVRSVEECLQLTGDWFSPQLAAAAILLGLLMWNALKACPLTFRNPGWFSFFSFGVLAASFAPPIFAQGVESYQTDRILASLYMLYAVLAILNILYWLGWLSRRFAVCAPAVHAWHAVLCAGLLVWGLFAGSILSTPCVASWLDVLTGKGALYHSEMSAREEALKNAGSAQEAAGVIAELSVQPVVLPMDKLIYQTHSPLPWGMHEYYRLAELTQTYGAGRIPQQEWDALEREIAQGRLSP